MVPHTHTHNRVTSNIGPQHQGGGLTRGQAHLLCVLLVRGGPPQVLRPHLDLQLLADLAADPLPLLVQTLLDAGLREVCALVQTQLLQHRKPAGVALYHGHKGR